MRLKTNLVISVVFAALLAFVYFYEIKGGDERELEAERARQVVDFSDHEAQRLTIAGPETTLVAERQDSKWQIRQPIETGADTEAIDRYLRSLKETEIEGEAVRDSAAVAGGTAALGPYGLDTPRLSVHLALAPSAETELDTLHFGLDTPTHRFTYVQRSGTNPAVRTVRAWRYDNLDKGLFDLRDRQVLHMDRDQVRELRLRHAERTEEEQIIAQRQGGGWQLSSPLRASADDAAIDEILNRLGNAKIESFIHEQPSPEDLDEAGLTPDQHLIQLTLVDAEGSQSQLRVGSRQLQGDHYAIDKSRAPIFIVDSTLVAQLTKTAEDLRDPRPFRMSSTVVGIQLQRQGQDLYQAARDSSGGWELSSHPDREAKAWRLNDLLTALDAIEVEEFVADADDVGQLETTIYGFASPSVRLTLQRDSLEPVVVEFAEVDGSVFARRVDVPSVYTVAPQSLTDLSPDLDEVALSAAVATDDSTASGEGQNGSRGQ